MEKKRGNPDWGKPDMHAAPVLQTSFEEVVRKLRLSPADYEGSLQLKEWVPGTARHKFDRDRAASSAVHYPRGRTGPAADSFTLA